MDLNRETKSLIKILSTNLKKWVKSNNISQRKLATTAGVAESTIRSIINGAQNIEIATLVKLKLVFSAEINDLLSEAKQSKTILAEPLPILTVQKAVVTEQQKIGKRISSIMKERGIDPETLSIMASNTDYSDTLKYLKGEINITLFTILKFASALYLTPYDLFDYDGKTLKKWS